MANESKKLFTIVRKVSRTGRRCISVFEETISNPVSVSVADVLDLTYDNAYRGLWTDFTPAQLIETLAAVTGKPFTHEEL